MDMDQYAYREYEIEASFFEIRILDCAIEGMRNTMPAGDKLERGLTDFDDRFAGAGLHLTLKSGNFGTDDFFSKAFEQLA